MDETIRTLLVAATLLPLLSSLVVICAGKRIGPASAWLATGVMGLSFVLAAVAYTLWPGGDKVIVWNVPWIPLDFEGQRWLYLGLLCDSLTIAMMLMVTFVATLVHVYSVGYMDGDRRYERFFGYLSLFSFSMLGIVISNSVMQLFVCWELVGLTSYLLIGFWYEKRGPQLACKKAFVMNRVGDAGFLVGFGILFYKLGGNVLLPAAEGTVDLAGQELVSMFGAIEQLLAAESAAAGLTGDAAYSYLNPPLWLTVAGLGLFCGAIGKSAQFPLQTWLPDAMEGPTPVSSIVHSATMVAAGVYLTARIYPILTPDAHLVIATIGLVTLVMAACMALVMTDIKRVLAYSTLSQLGYMVLALGAGAYTFALFHLITHAFFKCCLFQCSGSVIHAAHHQQDMRYYGGLLKKMPVTAACYGICTLAIAGASIPYTMIGMSGFYSKDGIIAGTINYGDALGGWGVLFWLGPVVVAYLTPFYMARSFALTFLGRPRDQKLHDHAHEAPITMLIPQVALASLAVVSGWFLFKGLIVASEPGVAWVQVADAAAGGLDSKYNHGTHMVHEYLLHGIGWILSLGAGILLYSKGFAISSKIVALPIVHQLYIWTYNKFYFDALYDHLGVQLGLLVARVSALFDRHIVDGLVNGAGSAGRHAAQAIGIVDRRVVDGAVDGAANFAQNMGSLLRQTQPGVVRSYVLMLFISASLVTLIVVTVVVAGRG